MDSTHRDDSRTSHDRAEALSVPRLVPRPAQDAGDSRPQAVLSALLPPDDRRRVLSSQAPALVLDPAVELTDELEVFPPVIAAPDKPIGIGEVALQIRYRQTQLVHLGAAEGLTHRFRARVRARSRAVRPIDVVP